MLQFSSSLSLLSSSSFSPMRLYRVDRRNDEPRNAGTGRWFTSSLRDLYWYWVLDPTTPIRMLDLPAMKVELFRVANLPRDHDARIYSARPHVEFFIENDAVLASAVVIDYIPSRPIAPARQAFASCHRQS